MSFKNIYLCLVLLASFILPVHAKDIGFQLNAAEQVQQKLNHYAPDKEIRKITITSREALQIARKQLGLTFKKSTPLAQGDQFFVQFPDQSHETQIATLVFSYDSRRSAEAQTSSLKSRRGYFRNTKILTRFAYGVVDNQVVVIFTENAGDEKLIKIIEDLASSLTANQRQK